MPVLNSYKAADGYITELTKAVDVDGWAAFQPPGIEFHGPCSIAVDDGNLSVDFNQQRIDFQAPDLMGQSQPDPGTPPDPSVVLATVAACQAWVSTATAEQKACYNSALWVHEQLTRTPPRVGIATALGIS